VQFKQATPEGGEKRFNGIAVALNPLINLLTENGMEPPTAEQIKNNINIHNIGVTKKAKQTFNVEANGTTISRSSKVNNSNATQTKCKICVLIKKTAFSPESWEIFTACKYICYSYISNVKIYLSIDFIKSIINSLVCNQCKI